MVARIRKDDMVMVLSGKDKGKQGSVIAILPKKGKVIVKDVAVMTKHVKARKAGEIAGIRKEEGFIDLSNVMPVCSSCKKACRVNSKTLDSGKKVRMCNRCEETF